ncbi:MAG: hypothetical protein J6S85_23485 [Methanobrevibacter sp.]|nr:hypothetical protein [Methanobrevibacter sp.]
MLGSPVSQSQVDRYLHLAAKAFIWSCKSSISHCKVVSTVSIEASLSSTA